VGQSHCAAEGRGKETTVPIYLVVAYAVFWALAFALIVSIWARQRRIDREIAMLKALLDDQENTLTG
jgi:hypothetical protein